MFNSVSLDENGLLWIGSNYGLSYYNPVTKQYTLVPNTLINEISSLICDRQGRVWIGTEEKLFAYLIKEKKFILFGEPDGVVQNELSGETPVTLFIRRYLYGRCKRLTTYQPALT